MNQTYKEARNQIEGSTVDENLAFLLALGLNKHQPLFMRIDTAKFRSTCHSCLASAKEGKRKRKTKSSDNAYST